MRICREVANVVGVENDLHVSRLPDHRARFALARSPRRGHGRARGALSRICATDLFDGTLSGFWNFALEPMHLQAWDDKDVERATAIWNGGLHQLHDYVADMGRLHIRYKTATWPRGLIPSP
jgi:hypothetical protein